MAQNRQMLYDLSNLSAVPPATARRAAKPVAESAPKVATAVASAAADPAVDASRVRVVVRVRPQIREDVENVYAGDGEYQECVDVGDDERSVSVQRYSFDERRAFQFDRVLGQDATQEDTYEELASNVVDSVLQGFNGTVMAYGQTGTGKTFTIFGSEREREVAEARIDPNDPEGAFLYDTPPEGISSDDGIIPRSLDHIFRHVEEHSDASDFHVTISLMQVYMENIADLLDPRKHNLAIREDPKTGVFVDQLTQLVVYNTTDALQLIREGTKNRALHQTAMNKVSTRSHVILLVNVEQQMFDGQAKRGVLTIVDLAGSERVNKSGSEGMRLEEAKRINRSLAALGNCVHALADGRTSHTPFRDSKLTRLLTDSLGGSSLCCLCANVGPAVHNYEEIYSTLLFAQRAMRVKTRPKINEVLDYQAMYEKLADVVKGSRAENDELIERNEWLEAELHKRDEEISLLRQRVEQMKEKQSDAGAAAGGAAVLVPERVAEDAPAPAADAAEWEQRESELVGKFKMVLGHLQSEIQTQHQAMDKMVGCLLNIPMISEKFVEQLTEEVKDEERTVQAQAHAADFPTADEDGPHWQ